VEEKVDLPFFTKIYYQDVIRDNYNLLSSSYNFPLPVNDKKYLSLQEVADV